MGSEKKSKSSRKHKKDHKKHKKRRLDSSDEDDDKEAHQDKELKAWTSRKRELLKAIVKKEKKLAKLDGKVDRLLEEDETQRAALAAYAEAMEEKAREREEAAQRKKEEEEKAAGHQYVPKSLRKTKRALKEEEENKIKEDEAAKESGGMNLEQWMKYRQDLRVSAKDKVDKGEMHFIEDEKDPECDKCGSKFHATKNCPQHMDISNGDILEDGQWACFKCSFHNKERRKECMKCGALYRTGYNQRGIM